MPARYWSWTVLVITIIIILQCHKNEQSCDETITACAFAHSEKSCVHRKAR